MKKYLLLSSIAFLCVCITTHAQIKKGATFLGGDIGGSSIKTKSADTVYSKQNGIYFSPVFGKAIRENLILGVSLLYQFYNNENAASVGYNLRQRYYGGEVFLRKYKPLGNSGFSVFAQAEVGVNIGKMEQRAVSYPYSQDTKTFIASLRAYPGVSFTVSKRLQLETGFNNLLSFNYRNEKRTVLDASNQEFKTTGFEVSSSLDNATSNLYLGFRVLLN